MCACVCTRNFGMFAAIFGAGWVSREEQGVDIEGDTNYSWLSHSGLGPLIQPDYQPRRCLIATHTPLKNSPWKIRKLEF